MRGMIAAAGLTSVAALACTSPQPYALVAKVLTVTGYTAAGALEWDMSKVFQGGFCDADSGNTCAPVPYLSGLPLVGEYDGLRALRSAIKSSTGETIVMGYSQGALIAADWIEQNAGRAGGPSPENLSFVLLGNPLRKYGGVRPAYDIEPPTPESDYHITDIALEYDGAADFPDNPFNLLALANAIAGFQYVHIYGYDDADLDTADKLVWIDGNTTYVLIRSQNIPLLEPLRRLGLDDLADRLNGPLKEIIDSAYDRNYPGLVDPETVVLQDVPSNPDRDDTIVGLGETSGTDHSPRRRWGSDSHIAALDDTTHLTDENRSTSIEVDDSLPDGEEDPVDGNAEEDTPADAPDAGESSDTEDTSGSDEPSGADSDSEDGRAGTEPGSETDSSDSSVGSVQ